MPESTPVGVSMQICSHQGSFVCEMECHVNISLGTLKIHFRNSYPEGVLSKRCSENMHQIYRRTPIPKCDFNKVAKQLY